MAPRHPCSGRETSRRCSRPSRIWEEPDASAWPPCPPYLIAVLTELALHLGMAPVTLVGRPLGATLAEGIALAHPEMVSRLILVDGGLFDGARLDAGMRPSAPARTRGKAGTGGLPETSTPRMARYGRITRTSRFPSVEFGISCGKGSQTIKTVSCSSSDLHQVDIIITEIDGLCIFFSLPWLSANEGKIENNRAQTILV